MPGVDCLLLTSINECQRLTPGFEPWKLNSSERVTDRTDLGLRTGLRPVLFLLRKEVIQPHLPIRLPCYDFTPIIDTTLDGCLSYELAHRFRVL